MRKSFKKMVYEFKQFWVHYVLQSILGATAFIVFTMPDNITAQARNVIGGQLVGLFFGFLFSLFPQPALIYSIALYSLAVGASIFTMVVTDTEHPPAAGTALGVAITGISLDVFIAVVMSIILLSLIHRFFKPYLKDLT